MLPKFLPAISSMSLGRAWNHALEPKLAACASHGFKAIELFYEDLEYVARSLPSSYSPCPPGTTFASSTAWDEAQLAAASYIHSLCTQHNLGIICLQPFMQYDGLICPYQHESRINKLMLWFILAKRLHTDLIQIPSNFLPASECTGDRQRIVADMQEVADLGVQQNPPIRFAYEALCWGTYINRWEQAWDIVKEVDRSNFGTCLDTFNLAGGVWADPASPSGKNEHADEDFQRSMARLREVDVSKIFYVEVVDAERMRSPLVEGHEWFVEGQPARMSWSRNARLFPFEVEDRGGYLPVLEIVRVITEEVGYQGYISFELFSRTMNEKGECVPEEHARRGERSWGKLMRYMGWNKADNKEMQSGKQAQIQHRERANDLVGSADYNGISHSIAPDSQVGDKAAPAFARL